MSKKELLANLTEEQLQKVRACKSGEELLALAQKEGVELSDEQLEAVSGGCGEPRTIGPCPQCGSSEIDSEFDSEMPNSRSGYHCKCRVCGFDWDIV